MQFRNIDATNGTFESLGETLKDCSFNFFAQLSIALRVEGQLQKEAFNVRLTNKQIIIFALITVSEPTKRFTLIR